MKKFIAVLLASALLSTSLIGILPVKAADTPVDYWVFDNDYQGTYKDAYICETLGYYGATWMPTYETWFFDVRVSGTAATRDESGQSPYGLYHAAINYSVDYDYGGTQGIWSNNYPKYVGSVPESTGSDPDYSDVLTAAAGYAISGINSIIPGANFAWNTAQLVAAMLSIYDDSYDDPNLRETERSWDYSLYQQDASQWFCVIVDVPDDTLAHFYQYYEISFIDSYTEELSIGPITVYCDTRSGEKGEKKSKDWNPGMMTEEEKVNCGLEEIPIEYFEKRAKELGISPGIIEECLKSGERVIYFAHNFKVEAVENGFSEELTSTYK